MGRSTQNRRLTFYLPPTTPTEQTKYKFELRVEVESLALHPMHKEKEVVIVLGKAGAVAGGRTASTPKPRKPAGPWGDTLALVVSLYRDRHGRYQPKPMQLAVKPAGGNAKPLATFRLDASHFASAAGTREACELQSVNKKVGPCALLFCGCVDACV